MTVNVVHCVDTEGPLDEKLKDTFKRLNEIFGLDIKASKENLKKLQNMKIPLNGLEKSVAKVVNKKNLNYQKNWKQIDKMLDNITSESFRLKYKDSFGKGWVFSWFCLDHVGFEKNRDQETWVTIKFLITTEKEKLLKVGKMMKLDFTITLSLSQNKPTTVPLTGGLMDNNCLRFYQEE